MLLQILEDGRLTDAKGRAIDFSNTIVILTSNLGAERMQKEASLGFHASSPKEIDELTSVHQENENAAREALKHIMRPELINRFDSIVVFHALTKKEAAKILDLQLADLKERLYRRGLSLKVKPEVKRHLLEKGYDVTYGARPMRRAVQDELEHLVADGLLKCEFNKGDVLVASLKRGTLKVEATRE